MKFNCGCEFEKLDWDDLNLNCPATWDLIGEGLTKGVFQLEKSLGRRWCKKVKPRNIEELGDVISLIRPGCLEAEYREDKNGKMLSISESYVKVKEGELEPEIIHPSLEPIMRSTYGALIYQEQIMDICKDFAGFTLQEADNIRRAVGKKDKKLIDSLEDTFVKSAVRLGRDEKMARLIFSWIEKFSGYGFNKSHAVGYAMLGYCTAYAKMHFPTEFFKAKLSESDSKIDEFDEIKQLVHEAKLFNIKVLPPSVRRMNTDFAFTDNNELAFGITHIKGVGESAVENLGELSKCETETDLFRLAFAPKPKTPRKKKSLDNLPPEHEVIETVDKKTGDEVTVIKTKSSSAVKKNVIEALIKGGALDHITNDRMELLKKFLFVNELTPREQKHLLDGGDIDNKLADDLYSSIVESGIPNKKRVPAIELAYMELSKALGGNKRRMALAFEKFHLGMALTGSETELYYNKDVDTTCANFLKLRNETKVALGLLIEEVRKIKDKNGNWMAFIKASDSSYMLDGIVVFASSFIKFGWLLEPGKVVLMKGKKRDTSLLVDFVDHL
jgi:DNA polymerase III alpha subunit